MTSAKKALILFVVTCVGLWGCARGPGSINNGPQRIKALESRIAKLEEDFRLAATARDQLKQQVVQVNKQRLQVVKERDDLQQQLTSRTTERDTLQTQYEQFRKNIRTLLGQAETAANNTTTQPVTQAATVSLPGKS
ncbi:MAG TPA: hypothetical protein VFA18_14855 [Gemmataceae bacterium]|nr:hypothetical protein [Gemmataceae bacterium]